MGKTHPQERVESMAIIFFPQILGFLFLLLAATFCGEASGIAMGCMGGLIICISYFIMARFDYREKRSKIIFMIIRYLIAVLMIVPIISNLFTTSLYSTRDLHFNYYALIFEIGFIIYLCFYQPSDTTILKKILKTLAILLNGILIASMNRIIMTRYDIFQNRMVELENYDMAVFILFLYIVDLIILYFGYRAKTIEYQEEDLKIENA